MEKVVLDSCVFAKLFLEEHDYLVARRFLRKLTEQNTQILVPSVFVYEVYYISQKYAIDFDFIEQLISQYQDFNLKEVSLSTEIVHLTKDIINKTSHPQSAFQHSMMPAIMLLPCSMIAILSPRIENITRKQNNSGILNF